MTSVIKIPYYATLQLLYLLNSHRQYLLKAIIATAVTYFLIGPWYLGWIVKGILSSIGLGFGMHTFVLFLAPHIASVTIAARTCKSLDFPQPPYPDNIICPDSTVNTDIELWHVFGKVWIECFMWGLGTAIGELPPYFAAKFQSESEVSNKEQLKGWQKVISDVITKVGFIGILLCASIPNPLFDAAGIASGTAQMPFLTFFGATFIGKAVNKMLIQTIFVISLFHGDHLKTLVTAIAPENIQTSLLEQIELQKKSVLTKKLNQTDETWMGWLFGKFVGLIVILFLISLIKTLSDNYVIRTTKKNN